GALRIGDGEVGRSHLQRELRAADPERRGAGQRGDAADPLSVDKRTVERAEVLDLDSAGARPYGGMPARGLVVVDHEIGALTSDHDLAIAFDALPLSGAGGDPQSRHRLQERDYGTRGDGVNPPRRLL